MTPIAAIFSLYDVVPFPEPNRPANTHETPGRIENVIWMDDSESFGLILV